MGVPAAVEMAGADAPRLQHVEWREERHLRRLYGLSLFLLIASATTGYDGMLVNNSQMMDRWENYFGDGATDEDKLGLLVNMFKIGSIISFFLVPFVADNYSRKMSIIIGCVIMVLGGFLSAFYDGYGSTF